MKPVVSPKRRPSAADRDVEVRSLPSESMPTSPKPAISRKRFLVNVGLLVFVVVVICLWFQRHVEQHFTASLMIGGTLSLWALFELIKGCVEWAAEDELKALPQRILGNRNSTSYLCFALAVATLLHACTSSVLVAHEPAENPRATYKVEVRYDKPNRLPFIEPLIVTSAKPINGAPFFFRWRSTPLRFDVIEPRGFLPVRGSLAWGRRVHVTVPADFARKQYRLLRLLPTPDVLNRLEEPGGPAKTIYALELKWGGKSAVVDDVRQQSIYVGADAEDMDDVLADEPADARVAVWNA